MIQVDLPSLNLLSAFVVSNGGVFTVNFDGGLDIATGLPLPIADDTLRLNGSGAYNVGFSLIVLSSSDITIAAGTPTFSGSFTAKSIATHSGQADATDLTKFISIPQTSIAMASGSLRATSIVLEATSAVNVTIARSTALNGSVSFGQTIVDSRAKIDLTGSDAGNRTRLESTTGAITISAVSQVVTSVARVPQNDGNPNDDDRAEDAAVAVSIITSKSDVHIGGTIDVVAGTTLTVNSNNNTNISTTADGLNGTSDAGGTLATANLFGDTMLLLDGAANVQAAGNVSLNAASNRIANTNSTTTVKGATKDNTKPNTKGQQSLADSNASNSDGNMGLAAAISILTITGDTTARIVDATVRSNSGTLVLNASGSQTANSTADGVNSSGSSDAGVGVVIAAVKGEAKASIGGTANVKGTAITVSGTVPTATSTLLAKSGPTSESQKASIGIAGAFANGVHTVKATAIVDPSANVNVNSSNLSLIASSITISSVTAIPFQNAADGSTLGLGASYALNVADRVTYAGIGINASLTSVNNLNIAATSNDTSTTRSKAGGSGGVALAVSVSNLVTNQDTLADIGWPAQSTWVSFGMIRWPTFKPARS